jgi:prepilin-type N-terminal cleavage/methylation domain-containing protein
MNPRGRSGFTLVELLVVIAIIGILMAMILPAVQAAREAARKLSCSNNLRQIGVAFQNHLDRFGYLPTGGWGHQWVGDADQGTDRNQPGGWVYNILPFMAEDQLHDLGARVDEATKRAAHTYRNESPLTMFLCPSRRAASTYPYLDMDDPYNSNTTATAGMKAAKTDYAANGGSFRTFPVFLDNAGQPVESRGGPPTIDDRNTPPWVGGFRYVAEHANGIVFAGSMVTAAEVLDGMSNTYMVAEKYLSPDQYETGESLGDRGSMYSGDSEDLCRWAHYSNFVLDANAYAQPIRDRPGLDYRGSFGGPHVGVWNCVFCDGSVRGMSYEISSVIHTRLCDRRDRKPIDEASF